MEVPQGSSELKHLILTRFNVMSGGKESRIRQQPGWLEERFVLFERFCFPSIVNQSMKDFVWLVFFDSETPEHFKQKIEAYKACGNFKPIFVDQWERTIVHRCIAEQVADAHKWLLTTRLDNDDGLHKDFVLTLRRNAEELGEGFYNFPTGLIYSNDRVFRHRDESNAFASFLEPACTFRTVWRMQHQEIAQSGQVYQLHLENAWLQVVHGSNVSNRIKGRRVRLGEWQLGYGYLEAPSGKESEFAIGWDNLVLSPLRRLREASIRRVKPLLK